MMETDWLTERVSVEGQFYECANLTSFFSWDGPPLLATTGLTMEQGRVVATNGARVRFGSPETMLRVRDRYGENTDRYTVHDDVVAEVYRVRTEDSTRSAYFLPSEQHLDVMPWFEGLLTVEEAPTGDVSYRLWHQRVRFSMDVDESHATDEHAYVCTPLDGGVPTVTTERGDETGLCDTFEPLTPVQPMAFSLDGATVR